VEINVAEFRTNCFKILDQVKVTHKEVVITKRGKPIAQVIPYRNSDMKPKPGKLANYLVFEKDIVSPLGEEMWDACK